MPLETTSPLNFYFHVVSNTNMVAKQTSEVEGRTVPLNGRSLNSML